MLVVAIMALGITWAAASPADAGHVAQDFEGTWRVSKWVGESQGGFSGPDPNSLLGSTVQITSTGFKSVQRSCHLEDPRVAPVGNRDIEAGLWGGQQISALRLSHMEIGIAFGRERTEVFQDRSMCVVAILLDHDHMLDAFGSGVIYKLDRVK